MNLLEFHIPEWFWVAFNLVVLIVILKKLLWAPVLKILAARQALAAKTAEDNEEAKRLLADAEAKHQRMHAEIGAESAGLLTDARSRAGREYDRIVSEAEEKAARTLAQARETAAQEKEKMLADANEQVTAAALAATAVLLRANMDSEKNKKLVEVYLAERDNPT